MGMSGGKGLWRGNRVGILGYLICGELYSGVF